MFGRLRSRIHASVMIPKIPSEQMNNRQRSSRAVAGQPSSFNNTLRPSTLDAIHEFIDVRVQRRGPVTTGTGRDLSRKRREFERLWKVPQRQIGWFQLRFERRPVGASLYACGL